LSEKVRAIHTNYHQAALVEEYIEGRDISIPILGNGDSVQILPPLECVFSPNFDGPRIQTFESKWVEDSADYRNCYAVCPCDLDAAVLEKIKEICSKAYCLLGCRDYARVDLRLRDHSPYIIEVNPNPCINPHDSGVVRAAQAAGYPFDGLINLIFTYSQINWKYPIPGMEGAIHGHLIDETHQERPVSSNQFITEN
jgi:D-alanine-D-alanine ligase